MVRYLFLLSACLAKSLCSDVSTVKVTFWRKSAWRLTHGRLCEEGSTVRKLPRVGRRKRGGVKLERSKGCINIKFANHSEVHMGIILDQCPHEKF